MSLKIEHLSPIIESEWFFSLEELREISNDNRAAIYDRESSQTQHKRGDAEARRPILEAAAEKIGFEVAGYYREVCSGQSCRLPDRTAFREAVGMNLPLVAPSVDRFVRPDEYDKQDQTAPLLLRDVLRLRRVTGDLFLATVIPPDTPLSDVRSRFTRWGQEGKGSFGGRPKN